MYSLNRATIIGNLTREPEVRQIPSGQSVCSFAVATNRSWASADGQKQEASEFHNIVAWGKLAEICAQYLNKGRKVYIEGRLQTRDWEGQDGVRRYRTEIVADRIQFGNRPGAGGAGTGSAGASGSANGSDKSSSVNDDSSQKDAPPVDTIDYPEEEIIPDDIPF